VARLGAPGWFATSSAFHTRLSKLPENFITTPATSIRSADSFRHSSRRLRARILFVAHVARGGMADQAAPEPAVWIRGWASVLFAGLL